MTKKKVESFWNRNFVLAMGISSVVFFSFGMLNPALPIYASTLGITIDIVGSIVAVTLIFCTVARAVIGGLSDMYSKKKLLYISVAVLIVAYIFYFISNDTTTIAVAKALQSIGHGLTTSVLSTLAFENLPQGRLGEGIGIYSLSGSLALAISPWVGTNLANAGMYRVIFAIALATTILAIIALGFIKPSQASDVTSDSVQHANKKVFHISDYISFKALPAAIVIMFFGVIQSAISNYLSIYGLSLGLTQIGIFFTIQSVTLILIRPVCGKIVDKKPMVYSILPGALAIIFTCLLVSNLNNIWTVCCAAILYGYGFGSTQAAAHVMAFKSTEPNKKGVANSTFYVGGDIGLAIGSWLAGILAYSIGYGNMFASLSIVALIGLIFFFVYSKLSAASKQKI